jgi:hypothetical protein
MARVEVKLYGQVQFGARAALQNLLAPAEVMSRTPDTIPAAIRQFSG